jgi:hypothetical protein
VVRNSDWCHLNGKECKQVERRKKKKKEGEFSEKKKIEKPCASITETLSSLLNVLRKDRL